MPPPPNLVVKPFPHPVPLQGFAPSCHLLGLFLQLHFAVADFREFQAAGSLGGISWEEGGIWLLLGVRRENWDNPG